MKYDINKIEIDARVNYTSINGVCKGVVTSIESERFFQVVWDDGTTSKEDVCFLEGISFPEEESLELSFQNRKAAKMLKEILGSI